MRRALLGVLVGLGILRHTRRHWFAACSNGLGNLGPAISNKERLEESRGLLRVVPIALSTVSTALKSTYGAHSTTVWPAASSAALVSFSARTTGGVGRASPLSTIIPTR